MGEYTLEKREIKKNIYVKMSAGYGMRNTVERTYQTHESKQNVNSFTVVAFSSLQPQFNLVTYTEHIYIYMGFSIHYYEWSNAMKPILQFHSSFLNKTTSIFGTRSSQQHIYIYIYTEYCCYIELKY